MGTDTGRYNTRPRMEVKLSKLEKFIEILTLFLLILGWAYIIYIYPKFPETIAIHFNFQGQADGYGSKITLIVLQAVSTISYILLRALSRYPHLLNYPQQITEENAEYQYGLAIKLLIYLNLGMVLLFDFIIYATVQVAMSDTRDKLMASTSWVIFLLVLLPIIIYFMYSARQKRHK